MPRPSRRNFSKRYFGSHDIKLPTNWEPDQNILNEFHSFLLKPEQGIQFTEAEFAENNDWIKRYLRKEMYITAFSVDEARRITVETDPMVEKAVESLPKAKALLEFLLPLEQHRRRAGDYDFANLLAHQQFSRNQACLDGFPQADIIGNKQIHARQSQRLS